MDDGFMDVDMAGGSRASPASPAPPAPPASTPAGRGRPRGSLTARGGEYHPKNNRVSIPERRGGRGRGRFHGSSDPRS